MKPTSDDLPTFGRYPALPEKEQTEDAEIWFPSWKCFCCHDSGLVSPPLVRLIIPDYDNLRDRSPVCQRCPVGETRINPNIHDLRFTRKICDRLDRFERDDWTETVKTRQNRIVELKELTDKLAMPGSRDRTENDNREVQLRKEEIESITPEQWLVMADQYSAGITPLS